MSKNEKRTGRGGGGQRGGRLRSNKEYPLTGRLSLTREIKSSSSFECSRSGSRARGARFRGLTALPIKIEMERRTIIGILAPNHAALSDILPFVFAVRSRAIELSNVPRNLSDSRRFMKASCYGCYAEFSIIISVLLITAAFQLHYLYIFINSLTSAISAFNSHFSFFPTRFYLPSVLLDLNQLQRESNLSLYSSSNTFFIQYDASKTSFPRERIIREILRGSY